MLDFAEIKRIKITDVVARYGVRLRYRGEWASAALSPTGINFVALMENCLELQAAQKLAAFAALIVCVAALTETAPIILLQVDGEVPAFVSGL